MGNLSDPTPEVNEPGRSWRGGPSSVPWAPLYHSRYLRIEAPVSDFVDWHLAPEEGSALADLGWLPTSSMVKAATPVTARGNGLVVVAPPAPAYAAPALAGLAAHLRTHSGTALLLVPGTTIPAWETLLNPLLSDTAVRWSALRGPTRGRRVFEASGPQFVLTTPETAAALQRRSELDPQALGAVVIIWPEQWDEDAMLPGLLQELPENASRIIVTAEPGRVTDLTTRYAWKAATAGSLDAPVEASPPVEVVTTPWHQRRMAVRRILEITDPKTVRVWSADTSEHGDIRSDLEADGFPDSMEHGEVPSLEAEVIVAYDIPTQSLLGNWTAERIFVLTPPGTESWASRWLPGAKPFDAGSEVALARTERTGEREAILARIQGGDLASTLLDLVPLFERFGAPHTAAALLDLWRGRIEKLPKQTPPSSPSPSARLWVNAGRKDEVSANDLVGLLTRELHLPRQQVGKIEVRETYSLVEISGEGRAVAEQLTGKMIRRRRIVARLDQGPQHPRH